MKETKKNITETLSKTTLGRPWLIALSIAALLLCILLVYILDDTYMQAAALEPVENISLLEYQTRTQKSYEIYKYWSTLEHQRVFDWHLRSTKIIFFISIFVAIIGMVLSVWQFIESSNQTTKISEENEMEIKTQLVSLAFKSKSIAALIMFLSLAYLLVYVKFLYPIKYTPNSPIPSNNIGMLQGESAKQDSSKPPTPPKTNIVRE